MHRLVAFPDHEYVSLHDRSELVTEVGPQVCLKVIINHVDLRGATWIYSHMEYPPETTQQYHLLDI